MNRRLIAFIAVAGLLLGLTDANGQVSPQQPPADRTPDGLLNLVSPTLGGKQFWSDELVFHDWRIQRHVYTDHYRLLDDKDQRRAWGTWKHCKERSYVWSIDCRSRR